MKTVITFFLLVFISAYASAQNKYYVDIADSIRIDSIVRAELNNPSNLLLLKDDTFGVAIYKTPSVHSEIIDYAGSKWEHPATHIIIDKGKQETIDGYIGYWYRIYDKKDGGKITGWMFEKGLLLIKPDLSKKGASYDGTYLHFIADPCIDFLTIINNNKQIVTAKVYPAYYNDTIVVNLCWTGPISLINVKVSGNIFSSDSSGFLKGWFMKSVSEGSNKFNEFLLIKNDDFFELYYKFNPPMAFLKYKYLYINSDFTVMYKDHSIKSEAIEPVDEYMICRILKAGPQETIDREKYRWYKILRNGQKGWVFGAFPKFVF